MKERRFQKISIMTVFVFGFCFSFLRSRCFRKGSETGVWPRGREGQWEQIRDAVSPSGFSCPAPVSCTGRGGQGSGDLATGPHAGRGDARGSVLLRITELRITLNQVYPIIPRVPLTVHFWRRLEIHLTSTFFPNPPNML